MYTISKNVGSVIICLFCLAGGLNAQTDPPASPTPTPATESATAATVQAPVNPYKGKFLFGDWGGSRLKMAAKGVNWDISMTQFGQTISGDRSDSFDYYGNKVDVFLNIDTEKAGMWKGGGIGTHVEYRYGNAPRGVTLFPTNTALFTPTTGERKVVFTSLYATQKIGKTWMTMFGKINPIDLLASATFFGGRGVDGFMNIAFAAPPSGVVPVSTYGVLFSGVVKKKYGLSIFIFDPTDQTGWHKPFQNGVNLSLGAVVPGKIKGLKSTHSFSATFSTTTGTNLSDLPQLIVPPDQRAIGTKQGPFNISYTFEQYFKQNPKNPALGWGMFAKFAIADGNPNPIQNSFHIGIAGTGVAKSRPLDRFGFGFYTYGLSNALKDALRPAINIQSERGAEAFYNLAVTPWLRITADLQVLPPTIVNKDTKVYFAVRTKINF